MVTCAFGMAALAGSVTVPLMFPKVACPYTGGEKIAVNARSRTVMVKAASKRFISVSMTFLASSRFSMFVIRPAGVLRRRAQRAVKIQFTVGGGRIAQRLVGRRQKIMRHRLARLEARRLFQVRDRLARAALLE